MAEARRQGPDLVPSYRTAVLLGGVSAERDISLKTGKGVGAALSQAGHRVFPVDIVSERIDDVVKLKPDVAFIALHGRFGEDGGVQVMLEEAEIPYTGSNAHSSRVAMDKTASKCFFMSHGVPTPDFRLVARSPNPRGRALGRAEIELAIRELGLPLVVKPVGQGSSLGVTVAGSPEEVNEGLACAFEYDEQAMLERYVSGREVTVGILGRQALPIVELRYAGRLFDYQAKYKEPGTTYVVGPDLPDEIRQRAQAAALLAHQALGCTAFSRVDMIIDREGFPHVLEVNTIPGMTDRSLYPMAARAAGMDFSALCDRLVRMAVEARTPAYAT